LAVCAILVVVGPGRAPSTGKPKLLLGRLYGDAGRFERIRATGESDQLDRPPHEPGPRGLGAEDQLANLHAVRDGTRVFSAYELRDGTRIWIITESDRSVTTILLPEEY